MFKNLLSAILQAVAPGLTAWAVDKLTKRKERKAAEKEDSSE
jgi:hypothetical protein